MLFLVTIFQLSAGLYATALTKQEAIIATRERATGSVNNRGLNGAGANPIAPGGIFSDRKSEECGTGMVPPSINKSLK